MQTIDTDRCSCLPNPSNGPHKGSGGAPRRSLRSGRALRRSHRAASPSKIGQKSPRPSQNGLPNANHRHRPLLMPSQSLQWTHKGSGGAARRSLRSGRALRRSHRAASPSKIGQKSPRPSQNGLPNANHRHRPLLMPSQSLQWTHKGSGRGGAALSEVRKGASQVPLCSFPIENWQKITPAKSKRAAKCKPMPLEEVHSSQIPPMDP